MRVCVCLLALVHFNARCLADGLPLVPAVGRPASVLAVTKVFGLVKDAVRGRFGTEDGRLLSEMIHQALSHAVDMKEEDGEEDGESRDSGKQGEDGEERDKDDLVYPREIAEAKGNG